MEEHDVEFKVECKEIDGKKVYAAYCLLEEDEKDTERNRMYLIFGISPEGEGIKWIEDHKRVLKAVQDRIDWDPYPLGD